MAGSEELENPPPPDDYVRKSDFDEFKKTIMETLRFALTPTGECSTPPVPILTSPTLGETAPAGRLDKETQVEEGRKEQGGKAKEEERSQGDQGPPVGQEQGWRFQPPVARPIWRPPRGPPQGQRRGHFQGKGNFQGEQGRFNLAGWQPDPGPSQPRPLHVMEIGCKRGNKKRGRGGKEARTLALPYCDFHQQEGHATAICPEFLEVREGRITPAEGRQLYLEGPGGS